MGYSRRTVLRQLKKFESTDSFADLAEVGAPKQANIGFNTEKEAELVNLCNENRARTSGELNRLLMEQNPAFQVKDSNLRRVLIKNGLLGAVCSRKPLLSEVKMVKRLAIVLRRRNKPFSFRENWKCWNGDRSHRI